MKTSGSFKKGHVGYWLGKKNLKIRTGEDRLCLICGKGFYVQLNQIKKGWGKYCSVICTVNAPKSDETRRRMSAWQKGDKHRNWVGGKKSDYRQRFNYMWDQQKKLAYKRDNYTCQNCGKECSYKDIQCHHIIPYRRCDGNEDKCIFWNIRINDLPNLVTLCSSCHPKIEIETRQREKKGDYGFKNLFKLASRV